MPGARGHMGAFAPDGLTYYETQSFRASAASCTSGPHRSVASQELPPLAVSQDGSPTGRGQSAGIRARYHEGTRVYAGRSAVSPSPTAGTGW